MLVFFGNGVGICTRLGVYFFWILCLMLSSSSCNQLVSKALIFIKLFVSRPLSDTKDRRCRFYLP